MIPLKKYEQLFESKFYHVERSDAFKSFLNHSPDSAELYELKNAMMKAESDISFIDLGKTNDTITFLQYSKSKLVNNFYYNNFRQTMKIGKFVSKMYKDSGKKDYQRHIESIVNMFKSYMDSKLENYTFEVISGYDIQKWYLEDNYFNGVNGPLNMSCMRHLECQSKLVMYGEYKDTISMLIMLNEKRELLGRALIWKLDDGKKYMDRIYVAYQHNLISFMEYGRKKLGIDLFFEEIYNLAASPLLEVTLNGLRDKMGDRCEYYPFMDTFKYFYYKMDILCNNRHPNYRSLIILDWF